MMMRSWTGILCLTSDTNGLRSLIQLLGLPPSVKGSSWAKVGPYFLSCFNLETKKTHKYDNLQEAVFDILIEIMQAVKSQELFIRGNRNLWKIMGRSTLSK